MQSTFKQTLITVLPSIDAILLFGLFLFYQSTIRSAFVQNVIIGILGFGFYSFWIPQIIRNVSRGCRKPLSPRYVIGISITRLTIPLCKLNSLLLSCQVSDYAPLLCSLDFYAYPRNIIAQEPSFGVWVLVGYVMVQVGILFLQDTLGPRFFVPERVSASYWSDNPLLTFAFVIHRFSTSLKHTITILFCHRTMKKLHKEILAPANILNLEIVLSVCCLSILQVLPLPVFMYWAELNTWWRLVITYFTLIASKK